MTAPTRQRPPNRRPLETAEVVWSDPMSCAQQRLSVGVGFDPASGRVSEVFAGLDKPGSMLDLMLAEACISISRELQSGHTPDDLLGRVLVAHDGRPLTPLGAVINFVAGRYRDHAAAEVTE